MSRIVPFVTCSLLVIGAMSATGMGETARTDEAPLRDRIEEIERRLALADRKFQLLSAESEAELSGGLTTFREPRLLVEQADAALARAEFELAYRTLTILQALHPDSPEASEAFLTAAALFKRAYFGFRLSDERTIWVTSEPYFLYQWLARHWDREYPKEAAEALLVGMPRNVFDDFQYFARRHPNLARWTFEVTTDNGIVRTLTAQPPPEQVEK